MGLFVSIYADYPTYLQFFPNSRRVYRQLWWLISIMTDGLSVVFGANPYKFI